MNESTDKQDGTHYRKVFDSPYLSSMDVVEPITLTIARVTQEPDKTKKSKDKFNTAYFSEQFIRPGEKLKPMILNATNSKMMAGLTGTPFIEDWNNVRVTIYVERGIKFGRDVVDGLRLMPAPERRVITPDSGKMWEAAKAAYRRDGSLDKVLAKADMSQEDIDRLIAECESQEDVA